MKCRFLLIFLFVTILCSSAQTTELLNINFRKFNGKTNEGGKLDTNVFDLALVYGFTTKKGEGKNTFFFRPSHHQRIIEGGPVERLYKPELIAGVSHQINDTWTYRVFGILRLASDFKEIDNAHFQPGISGILSYTKNDHLNFFGGIYIRNQPDNLIVFPLLGMAYTFGDDRWFLDALLPQYAQLKYDILLKKFSTGLRLNFVTERYKSSDQFQPVDYVELTQFQTEIFTELYLTKNIVALAKYGLVNFQKYELFNSDEIVLNRGSEEVNDVLSFHIGLAYRL